MNTTLSELPLWDLNPIFPGLHSPAFEQAWNQAKAQLEDLKSFIPQLTPSKESFDTLLQKLNAFGDQTERIQAYLYLLISVNTADAEAQAKLSEHRIWMLDFRRLRPKLTQFLAALDPQQVEAGDYSLLIEEAKLEAQHQMSEAEEILAAELSLSGGSAWVKLYEMLSSQVSGSVNGEELPVTALRNFAFSPSEAIRKAAYESELEVWKAHETALAACINGYKGQVSTLNQKRRWEDDLAPTLFENRITREALFALQSVMVQSFTHWRRYFATKAKALGKKQLDWWDLVAPMPTQAGHPPMQWNWESGREFIIRHLAAFSAADAELAKRAYAERWIDASPRKGKVGGAFCMPLGQGLSRILTNHEDGFESVSTMAHELGHAYHNHCLRGVPYLIRKEPMTLAETASIMNETIVGEAAMQVMPPSDQIAVLEGGLQSAAQVIVDIHSRFLFESTLFTKRRERDLSPAELCGLMTQAQSQTYGDGVATYHPYMWAVKGHYYGSNFYNYPYAFGLLFGLSLYERFRQEGPAFVAQYDDLLASAGKYPAQALAQRFGFDLESEGFWQSGMNILIQRINRLERLIE